MRQFAKTPLGILIDYCSVVGSWGMIALFAHWARGNPALADVDWSLWLAFWFAGGMAAAWAVLLVVALLCAIVLTLFDPRWLITPQPERD